ncbi:MAG TPA: hypothetical protein VKC60_05735 [Opitutaceae bacterium]|nr:hypothetical protein [Opitutaceae bacterium]
MTESVGASIDQGISASNFGILNLSRYSSKTAYPERFQEEAVPAALSYVAHPFEKLHAAWARFVLRVTSSPKLIDQISVYGVSWWFEPAIALGLFCFVPWSVATALHYDTTHFVPWLIALSHGGVFVATHWEGVFETQEDGSLVFKHFREPGDSWATGMDHRLAAWKALFWEGMVFHAPFYAVLAGLKPQTDISTAVHQLATPFIWAMLSHLGSQLLPLIPFIARRWQWTTATSDISRPRNSAAEPSQGIVKQDALPSLSNEAMIWLLVEMLRFRPLETVWSDGEDDIYFYHKIRGVAPHDKDVPSQFREKIVYEGVEFWHQVHQDANGRLNDRVDWFIRLPPQVPEPAQFLQYFIHAMIRNKFGSEFIAGDWTFVRRLIGVFAGTLSRSEIEALAQITHQDLHGTRFAVQLVREEGLEEVEIQWENLTWFVKAPAILSSVQVLETVTQWIEKAEQKNHLRLSSLLTALLAEHFIWRTLAGLERPIDMPVSEAHGRPHALTGQSDESAVRKLSQGPPLSKAAIRQVAKEAYAFEKSPDGRYVAKNEHEVVSRIFDLQTKTEIVIEGGPFTLIGTFSPTNDVVLAHHRVRENYVAVLLDLKSHPGKAIPHHIMEDLGKSGVVYDVRFSAHGKYWIVSYDGYQRAELFARKTLKKVRLPPAKLINVSPNEKLVEIAPLDKEDVRLIEIATGRPLGLPKGTTGVAFLANRTQILAHRTHDWAAVYDIETGKTTLTVANLWATQMTISPDRKSAVVVLNAEKLPRESSNVLLLRFPFTAMPLEGASGIIDKITFSPDSQKVTVGPRWKDARTYSTLTGQLVRSPRATWGLTRRVVEAIFMWVGRFLQARQAIPPRRFSALSGAV